MKLNLKENFQKSRNSVKFGNLFNLFYKKLDTFFRSTDLIFYIFKKNSKNIGKFL